MFQGIIANHTPGHEPSQLINPRITTVAATPTARASGFDRTRQAQQPQGIPSKGKVKVQLSQTLGLFDVRCKPNGPLQELQAAICIDCAAGELDVVHQELVDEGQLLLVRHNVLGRRLQIVGYVDQAAL